MISTNIRQAYTEIDNFIELLDDYNKNKVPKKLRDFFKKEKDNNYTKTIDATKPIKEQNLKEETLALIALLNLQYWCEDEEEKKRLKAIYDKNQREYENKLYVKYNPSDIFKKKEKNITEDIINPEKNIQMIEYQEPVFKRVINKILNFLHLR